MGELRAQSKPRARSPRELRAKREIERGEGSGRAPPQKFFENSYLKPCILVYSLVEAKIYNFPPLFVKFISVSYKSSVAFLVGSVGTAFFYHAGIIIYAHTCCMGTALCVIPGIIHTCCYTWQVYVPYKRAFGNLTSLDHFAEIYMDS